MGKKKKQEKKYKGTGKKGRKKEERKEKGENRGGRMTKGGVGGSK